MNERDGVKDGLRDGTGDAGLRGRSLSALYPSKTAIGRLAGTHLLADQLKSPDRLARLPLLLRGDSFQGPPTGRPCGSRSTDRRLPRRSDRLTNASAGGEDEDEPADEEDVEWIRRCCSDDGQRKGLLLNGGANETGSMLMRACRSGWRAGGEGGREVGGLCRPCERQERGSAGHGRRRSMRSVDAGRRQTSQRCRRRARRGRVGFVSQAAANGVGGGERRRSMRLSAECGRRACVRACRRSRTAKTGTGEERCAREKLCCWADGVWLSGRVEREGRRLLQFAGRARCCRLLSPPGRALLVVARAEALWPRARPLLLPQRRARHFHARACFAPACSLCRPPRHRLLALKDRQSPLARSQRTLSARARRPLWPTDVFTCGLFT